MKVLVKVLRRGSVHRGRFQCIGSGCLCHLVDSQPCNGGAGRGGESGGAAVFRSWMQLAGRGRRASEKRQQDSWRQCRTCSLTPGTGRELPRGVESPRTERELGQYVDIPGHRSSGGPLNIRRIDTQGPQVYCRAGTAGAISTTSISRPLVPLQNMTASLTVLPAIKCSTCGAEVDIAAMGEHVCVGRSARAGWMHPLR